MGVSRSTGDLYLYLYLGDGASGWAGPGQKIAGGMC
jgi:hypothetical protein